MERFYEKVATVKVPDGWSDVLDGRVVKTPATQGLTVPQEIFADALADEWRTQKTEIVPLSMPLTRLANTALDRTAPNREQVIDEVAGYGKSDLLCYQTAEPTALAELQARHWQPVLDWLAVKHRAPLSVTFDIAPIEQSGASLLAVHDAVARLDNFVLTGLHAATAICGSVAVGLALLDRWIDAAEAWRCALLDEQFQAERWGADEEEKGRWAAVRTEIETASGFMSLARNRAS